VTLLAAVGMAREARIVGGPGVRVAVGGGRADVLARALEEALDANVTALISIGICGALDPDLSVGDVIIGTEILGPDGAAYKTHPAWTEALAKALPAGRAAAIWGSDAMVIDAREKARLRETSGAAVADMESHFAARLAQAHGLDFAALRVVSDAAETSLPSAVLDGLKPDGSPNLVGVLLGLARRPSELPALIRLGRDSEQALKALAGACAQAGPAFAYPILRQ
jgi:adenosylhomocysteine nucleosidase